MTTKLNNEFNELAHQISTQHNKIRRKLTYKRYKTWMIRVFIVAAVIALMV